MNSVGARETALASGFVTICPKKEVELGADRLLHRADHAAELATEISFSHPLAATSEVAVRTGGAVRAINPSPIMTLAQTDTCIAVFKGTLTNRRELAAGLQPGGDSGAPCPSSSSAALLLALYSVHGLDMLGKLQGRFAFCLYDSVQARVLAARDHSGAVPLLQGRTAAGSLIIACGTFLPDGCSQLMDIQPGEYKYGWHALPRTFKCGEAHIVAGRASCDYGIRRRSVDAFNAPLATHTRRSVDIPRQRSIEATRGAGHEAVPRMSQSYTPGHSSGRYMPPHMLGRARTASSDGHAQGAAALMRRRSDCGSGNGSSGATGNAAALLAEASQATPAPAPAPAAASAAAAVAPSKHMASQLNANAAQWVPKGTATAQARALTPPTSAEPPVSPDAADPGTPCAVTSPAGSDGHRRRRRHHRRGKGSTTHSAGDAHVNGAGDGHASDGGSNCSSGTHENGRLAGTDACAEEAAAGAAAADAPAAVAAPVAAGNGAAKQQQQLQPPACASSSGSSGGVPRTGSCSELAALGSSPAASVLRAAPQGLAC